MQRYHFPPFRGNRQIFRYICAIRDEIRAIIGDTMTLELRYLLDGSAALRQNDIYIHNETGSRPCSVPSIFTLGKYNVEIIQSYCSLPIPPFQSLFLFSPSVTYLEILLVVVDFFCIFFFTIAKQKRVIEGIDDIEDTNIDSFYFLQIFLIFFLSLFFGISM